jgi:hypothetical protein
MYRWLAAATLLIVLQAFIGFRIDCQAHFLALLRSRQRSEHYLEPSEVTRLSRLEFRAGRPDPRAPMPAPSNGNRWHWIPNEAGKPNKAAETNQTEPSAGDSNQQTEHSYANSKSGRFAPVYAGSAVCVQAPDARLFLPRFFAVPMLWAAKPFVWVHNVAGFILPLRRRFSPTNCDEWNHLPQESPAIFGAGKPLSTLEVGDRPKRSVTCVPNAPDDRNLTLGRVISADWGWSCFDERLPALWSLERLHFHCRQDPGNHTLIDVGSCGLEFEISADPYVLSRVTTFIALFANMVGLVCALYRVIHQLSLIAIITRGYTFAQASQTHRDLTAGLLVAVLCGFFVTVAAIETSGSIFLPTDFRTRLWPLDDVEFPLLIVLLLHLTYFVVAVRSVRQKLVDEIATVDAFAAHLDAQHDPQRHHHHGHAQHHPLRHHHHGHAD